MQKIFAKELIVHVGILLVLSFLVFFLHLDRYPFFNKGEPREGLVVQSIVSGGDWILPLKNGTELPSKPPLFHWVGALASLARGGVTEATVRFPSALFATLGILCVYVLGRMLFNPSTGFWGGVILATTLDYQSLGVSARVDMALAFFVTLSSTVFYLIYSQRLEGARWRYILYVILGVGILAKGPIGFILPVLVICIFLGLKGRKDLLYDLFFHRGMILILIIGVSWYAMAWIRGGEEFFDRHIIRENFARFFSYGGSGTGHEKPIYYYIPYFFLNGLPWSIFLPLMLTDCFRRKAFAEDRYLFPMIWMLGVFVFFSLSGGKRPDYLLPLFPPMALLIAGWFRGENGLCGREVFGNRLLAGYFLVTGILLGMPSLEVMGGQNFSNVFSAVGSLMKPKDQAQFLFVQNAFEEGGWKIWSSVLLSGFLCFMIAWNLFHMQIKQVPTKLALLVLITWTLGQTTFIPAIAEEKSYRSFVREMNLRLKPGEKVYIYGGPSDWPPLVFYHRNYLPLLNGSPEELTARLVSTSDFIIMPVREWERLQSGSLNFPMPLLKSRVRGSSDKARLVLVRGLGRGS